MQPVVRVERSTDLLSAALVQLLRFVSGVGVACDRVLEETIVQQAPSPDSRTRGIAKFATYPTGSLSLVALLITHYCCSPVHNKGMAYDSGCRF